MAARVVVLTNPLDASKRRELTLEAGVALLPWVDEHAGAPARARRAVFVNGFACLDPAYRVQADDRVLVTFTPGYATVGQYIVQAIIAYIIGYTLTKIFAPTRPKAANTPQASQVYGIAPPKNAARLGQPIPALYGSVIALPDFAAQPYTVFVGNDQYLHALLCLGLGEFDVAEMLLADTQTATLPAGVVQWRAFGPTVHGSSFGVVEGQTGVRENVVTSPAVANQELVAPNAGGVLVPSTWYWVLSNTYTSMSPPGGVNLTGAYSPAAKIALLPPNPVLGTAVAVTLGYNGSTYTAGTYTAAAYVPTQNPAAGDLVPPPHYDAAGQGKWVGPFASCKPGQHGSLVEYDFTFPAGLYTGDSSGNLANCTVTVTVEAQPIDNAGNPTGDPTQTFAETFTAKDNTPQRFTLSHAVPSGRYQVRAQRTSNSDLKTSTSDHVIWAGLKFQLDPPPVGTLVYGNVTLVSVIMKATNGVADEAASSMRFRVTRRLAPLGVGATAATVNPADAFVDIVTAAYGANRPRNSDELDLDELTTSRALWADADGFNAVFDQASTVWEALGLALQCVNAAPMPIGSRLSLIHDGPQAVQTQLFTDANIAAGSLALTESWDADGTPAGFRMEYRDPATFSSAVYLLPADAPDYTTVSLFGCTSLAVAQEMATLAANKRREQRSALQFTTELEALACLPGDRIGVQSGMMGWAQTARVVSMAGLALTLDRPLAWTVGATHAASLRDPTGTPQRFAPVTRGGADHVLVLPAAPGFAVQGADSTMEATIVAFGIDGEDVTDWTVTKITPQGVTVVIDAVNYVPTLWDGAASYQTLAAREAALAGEGGTS